MTLVVRTLSTTTKAWRGTPKLGFQLLLPVAPVNETSTPQYTLYLFSPPIHNRRSGHPNAARRGHLLATPSPCSISTSTQVRRTAYHNTANRAVCQWVYKLFRFRITSGLDAPFVAPSSRRVDHLTTIPAANAVIHGGQQQQQGSGDV
jgi:hypothetical protein